MALETKSEEQIELLEIYVEKSRALGLGQRLLWHLDKFNKRLVLPHIPDAKDLYLQPLSVISRVPSEPGLSQEAAQMHRSESTFGRELLYTEESNTIFYYNDYRVVLLLDFSQSTNSVYPTQEKSYLDKMRESLDVVMKNLLFMIQNKLKKPSKSKALNPNGEASQINLTKRKANDLTADSKGKHHPAWYNLRGGNCSSASDLESDFYLKDKDRFSAIEE